MSTYSEVFLLKSRSVVFRLYESDLRQVLVDHFVKEGVLEVVDGLVKVSTDEYGWWVGKMTPVPTTPRDPDGDRDEQSIEVLRIEVNPPLAERS